ncbi:hypothetical protein HanIR_Chr05g0224481 [Helianthus annuus]|nr:hypothetical protein HanIR_Chr05g0224481 [Helianthus annuus]
MDGSDRITETHQVIVIQNKALLHIMLVQSHLQIHQRKENDVKVVQSVLKRIMATEQHLILSKPKTPVENSLLEVQMPLCWQIVTVSMRVPPAAEGGGGVTLHLFNQLMNSNIFRYPSKLNVLACRCCYLMSYNCS